MKVSLKWLSRYVDLDDLDPHQVFLDLTMSTCEVEELLSYGGGLDEIVVGRVIECGKHPDADKLSVTKVDTGDGELRQIVCGASNVAKGQAVPVIRPGQTLPGGLKIKKSKIRGQESHGMICSEKELGLAEDSPGIMVLSNELRVGTRFVDAVDVVDHVLEIDNKSINHRPDLWGHYGIARELAAIYDRPLRPLGAELQLPADGRGLEITIEDTAVCARYTGLIIEGARAQPSPDWMRFLLEATGQRAINLLVDLTNFVMLDLGQPMHAFDLRQVEGKTIGVRNARDGERIVTLDGEDRELVTSDLLITAGDEPVALAGIMGGEGTMVLDDTEALFIECANFDAATVRRTGTRLGLRTDSSTRFEKSIDPVWAERAQVRYLELLQHECPDAVPAGPIVDPSGWRFEPRSVKLRRSRLDLKLGIEVDDARVERILTSLQFGVSRDGDDFEVDVPSFRATKDVTIEDDLIEEVGRMFRYDNIPELPLYCAVEVPHREPALFLARRAVEVAATELAHHEVYNYSFVPDALLEACLATDRQYSTISNPVAPELTRMRRHVLPSVLGCVAQNLRVQPEVRLFECGKGYHPDRRDEHGLPYETHELALVWSRRDGEHPYAELRRGVETLLERVGYPATLSERYVSDDHPWAHPGRTAAIHRGDRMVGFAGACHPHVCRNLDIPATTAIATVALDKLLETGRDTARYDKLSPYPTQPVDVALLVDTETKVADVAAFLRQANPKLVTAVELFEVYSGEGIPAGKKSLNFTVTLGSMDRTLTSKDEEKYLNKVRSGAEGVGAELRG